MVSQFSTVFLYHTWISAWMSFSVIAHSTKRSRLLHMAHAQIRNCVYVRRIPGSINYQYILLCHEIFHKLRCVMGEKSNWKSRNCQNISFPALEQLFFEELQYIVASASFVWLAEGFRHRSNWSIAKTSFYASALTNWFISESRIFSMDGWSSKLLISLTLYKEMAFNAENNFSQLLLV